MCGRLGALREFGVERGYSTAALSCFFDSVTGVDTFQGDIHTRDPRYFMPAMVGIDPTREAALRGAFVDAIPEPWLKASALAVAPIVPAGTDAPKISAEPSSAPEHPLPHVPLPGEGRPWIQPIH